MEIPVADFPRPLDSYPAPGASILATLATRAELEPFNLVATGIFVLAIVHTFAAARFTAARARVQHAATTRPRPRACRRRRASRAELLHFLGEVEVVFGLWAVVLLAAIALDAAGRRPSTTSTTRVNYTEPLFVVVIMALASTRPIVAFAEAALRRVARARRRHAGGVVGRDPDDRPAARLVHHRAGGDDDLRAAAGAPVLRPRARARA